MAIPAVLREYLAGAKYDRIRHRKGYTASEVAGALGIPPALLAKTVVLAAGGRGILAVVPATCRVDLDGVRRLIGDRNVAIVPESSLRGLFPDCAIGTMPPLGGPYGMEAIIDARIAGQETITFQAGSHEEVVRMSWEEFARIESPRIGEISTEPGSGSAPTPSGTSP